MLCVTGRRRHLFREVRSAIIKQVFLRLAASDNTSPKVEAWQTVTLALIHLTLYSRFVGSLITTNIINDDVGELSTRTA